MRASVCGVAVEIRPFGYLSTNSAKAEDTVWWVV
jgi:hypothetical protein